MKIREHSREQHEMRESMRWEFGERMEDEDMEENKRKDYKTGK